MTHDASIGWRLGATALLTVACRQSAPPQAAGAKSAAAAMVAGCAADSLRPVAAAPATGLWVGARATPPVRVMAMVGTASTDGERARITRRVETLELAPGADSIRLANDTASVRLELLPPFQATLGERPVGETPAAVYSITSRVLLASYEPCALSASEPRIRYLRRDTRGAVATDLMLRRESAEEKGLDR